MELRDLKAFMAVVEHRSFTKAAHDSFVSQPSLSKSIKKLEASLQVELLNRSTRNVELTDAGSIVYHQGQKIMQAVQELHILLDDLLNIKTGAIKLGIPPLIGTLFFPEIARRFHQLYPEVHLALIERGAKMVEMLVENGDVDMGIVVLPVDERKFAVQPFIEDQFYVFMNESHPYAHQESIALKDLENETFIIFAEEFTLHDYIIKSCESVGFTPTIGYKSSQWDLIVELVSSNLGVTLLPHSIAAKQTNTNVKIIPLDDFEMPWRLGIITKKNAYQSYALKQLLEMIGKNGENRFIPYRNK
ncbi:LysR family transcriptional regulator [Lysinibacillus sp. OL1_EC]|uniref:LysR family transcriptional regulator n=1 Tax=unclassified Lysinibacillus TaxID=2636778 RepID=UPI001040AB07|nr:MULTISPECIES: LysR family transcriptional regulator [unclassified Lysinibacillus]MCM0626994.1 LysR family transcriptional regulator [Lysinibacillus sp. OL1_EC]MCS5501744.1 LysR family transcriptional regulator [Lysinibacillus sp. A4]TBV85098.1 LysR family transcriptional regulator [Lysinibacillus sp. OL1]UKJ45762.1 LysR family transcriptional regulator [Lysinibacillus sp. ACHW1.5]WGT39228.1 LysR family transcriptional regulator [Lysinibacillus sp. 1 U-2021]